MRILTGGTVISEERGFRVRKKRRSYIFGQAEKIIVDKDNTTIIDGTAAIRKLLKAELVRLKRRLKPQHPITTKKSCRNV